MKNARIRSFGVSAHFIRAAPFPENSSEGGRVQSQSELKLRPHQVEWYRLTALSPSFESTEGAARFVPRLTPVATYKCRIPNNSYVRYPL